MTLIKKKSKVTENSSAAFVGFFIPKEAAHFLNLYSISEGVTKTLILSGLVKDWRNERLRDTTDEELVEKIVKRSLDSYKDLPKRTTNFMSYCSLLRTELKNKIGRAHV